MCDYSLQHVATRAAKVDDLLVSTKFNNSITRGFASVGEPNVAVCILPGTELAFEREVECDHALGFFPTRKLRDRVALTRLLPSTCGQPIAGSIRTMSARPIPRARRDAWRRTRGDVRSYRLRWRGCPQECLLPAVHFHAASFSCSYHLLMAVSAARMDLAMGSPGLAAAGEMMASAGRSERL